MKKIPVQLIQSVTTLLALSPVNVNTDLNTLMNNALVCFVVFYVPFLFISTRRHNTLYFLNKQSSKLLK